MHSQLCSRHLEALTSIKSRLSVLEMVYSKWINQGRTCFIPGRVLDEAFHLLRILRRLEELPVIYLFLRDLRDLSYHPTYVISP